MSSVYSTLTQLQSNTNKVNFERGRDNLGNDKLGKDAFMQLMLAQLQYQDPTEPTDNAQFLQQQAMYAQTESIQQLNQTLSLTSQMNQATALVGKYVEVGYMEDGKSDPTFKTGKVDSIVIADGQVGLRVGDLVYNLNQVSRVFDGPPAEGDTSTPMPLPDQIVEANKLNGKYVRFKFTPPGATAPITYTGLVTEVTNDDKSAIIKMGDQVFDYSQLSAIESSTNAFPET
ncbi:MAG: flagellar hook capping FlgD N-terminal domain-containing protein [Vampirovibrionales bacterium]|nr:flagellar hook capping FlgD N-terminal domain-containing protein [Vampirovibrionales bacterium]